jgi:hypothetical protein
MQIPSVEPEGLILLEPSLRHGCLILCSCNDGFLQPHRREVIMNDELGRVWKELIVVCSKVLYQRFAGGSKENHTTRIQH